MDKIVCVGKNYAEHAKELGDAIPEKPVLFLKPPSVLLASDGREVTARLPKDSGSVHHECEIVLRLGPGGKIRDVTLGLDMTLRERQAAQKKAGHPWTTSKVFPDAAIVGPFVPLEADWLQSEFFLQIDGKIRQRGRGDEMTFSPEACLAYIAGFFPLCEGDLVFTGTPAGVGPVVAGNVGKLSWGRVSYTVRWT